MRSLINPLDRVPRVRIFFLQLLFLTSLFYKANSQTYTNVYDVAENVKGYSTEMCTDYISAAGETVKAGTIYDFNGTPGLNVAHFLNVADDGTVNYSVYYRDPQYQEIRVVDIVGDENGGMGAPQGTATYYITCLARTASSNDRILVIPIDNTGAMVGSAISLYLDISSTGTPDDDKNLYPLHSIYGTSRNELYICGYYTLDPTGNGGTSLSGTGEPDYTSEKWGFVTSLAWSGTAWTPNIITGTNTYISPAGTYSAPNDYDIGMRLVETNSGDIFMTGSVNDIKFSNYNGNAIFHSATMNYIFDPNLAPWAGITNNHFTLGAESQTFGDEYGVDLVQAGPNDNYVIGNYFYHFGNAYPTSGFDVQPSFLWATWIDGSYAPNLTGTPDSRVYFNGYDYAWALQALEGPAPVSTSASAARFVIAGMETNEWCNGGPLYAFQDDVRAFLHDFEVEYNSSTGISYTFGRWTTYRTQAGTGVMNTDPNSYWDLGTGLSNIAWNPTFAARESYPDDIYVSAPTWRMGSPDLLNLKNIRVDGDDANTTYLEDNNCSAGQNSEDDPVPITSCGIANPYLTNPVLPMGDWDLQASPMFWGIQNTYDNPTFSSSSTPTSGHGAMITGSYSVSVDACTSTNPAYKLTGISEEIQNKETTVFPNPASKEVFIALSGNINNESDIEIKLLNLQGQAITVLFNGIADQLHAKKAFSIQDVPSGIYLIQILENGNQNHIQKLIINQ